MQADASALAVSPTSFRGHNLITDLPFHIVYRLEFISFHSSSSRKTKLLAPKRFSIHALSCRCFSRPLAHVNCLERAYKFESKSSFSPPLSLSLCACVQVCQNYNMQMKKETVMSTLSWLKRILIVCFFVSAIQFWNCLFVCNSCCHDTIAFIAVRGDNGCGLLFFLLCLNILYPLFSKHRRLIL